MDQYTIALTVVKITISEERRSWNLMELPFSSIFQKMHNQCQHFQLFQLSSTHVPQLCRSFFRCLRFYDPNTRDKLGLNCSCQIFYVLMPPFVFLYRKNACQPHQLKFLQWPTKQLLVIKTAKNAYNQMLLLAKCKGADLIRYSDYEY